MKKSIALLMVVVMGVELVTGCGKKDKAKETENATPVVTATPVSVSAPIAVKTNDEVTITIPATYFGEGLTQEDLDEIKDASEGVKSIKLNDDGSATYVMTTEAHEATLSNVAAQIEQGMEEMSGSDAYPHIKSVKGYDDYTSFDVSADVSSESELAKEDMYCIYALFIYGDMYNSYAGNVGKEVTVYLLNDSDGSEIRSYTIADFAG